MTGTDTETGETLTAKACSPGASAISVTLDDGIGLATIETDKKRGSSQQKQTLVAEILDKDC